MIGIARRGWRTAGVGLLRPVGRGTSSTCGKPLTNRSREIATGGVDLSAVDKVVLVPPSEGAAFSVRMLAERWSCSEGAVRALIRHGLLNHFRVGELIRVRAEDVARYECRS